MDKVIHNPKKPFTAIMGGAKVSDKILLIENLLEKSHKLFDFVHKQCYRHNN